MKKIVFAILAFLLTSCSALPELPALSFNRPTPAPPVINTPQPTVTLISDGWTKTPDLFALNTPEPTATLQPGQPSPTSTRFPTLTPTTPPTITLEPQDPTLFTPGPNPFTILSKSTSQLVWGSTCDGARSIKFVVQLIVPIRHLKYVTLWYRLQDKYSSRHTNWGGGAIMLDNDRGTYFATIELNQIESYRYFEDAWFQYQFVASSITGKRLGSSIADHTGVSLTHCKVFNP